MTHENRDAFATPDGESLSCAACQALLPEYVAGVLATPRQEAVAWHLVGCAACCEEERQWRLIGEAFQSNTSEPSSAALTGAVAAAWFGIATALVAEQNASAGHKLGVVEPGKNMIDEDDRAMSENALESYVAHVATKRATSATEADGPTSTPASTPPRGKSAWLSGLAAVLIVALLVGGVFFALRHLGTKRIQGNVTKTGTHTLTDPQHVVVASTRNGAVTAFDPATGAIRWSKQLTHNKSAIIFIPGMQGGVVIVDVATSSPDLGGGGNDGNGNTFYALRTQDGATLWHNTFASVASGNSVIGAAYADMNNGVVYIELPQGDLLAVRATDGATLWDMPNTSEIAVTNSFLYVAHGWFSDTITVEELRIDTRALVWSHTAHLANVAMVSELFGSRVYIGGIASDASSAPQHTYVEVLDAKTGQVLAPFHSVGADQGWGVTDFDTTPPEAHYFFDDMLLFMKDKIANPKLPPTGPFCAVQATTGRTLWCDPLGQTLAYMGNIALASGKLYINAQDGLTYLGRNKYTYRPAVVTLNAASGTIRWQWIGPRITGSLDSPAIAVEQNRVFVSTAAGIFAMDATTGRQLWRVTPQVEYLQMLAS